MLNIIGYNGYRSTFLVTSKQKVFSKLYLAYVFLFAMGTVFTMWQVINGINNVNLKKQEKYSNSNYIFRTL